jgi:hypothetical protein
MNCKMYFDNIETEDFLKFMRSATEIDFHVEKINRELPGFSPEITGLLIAGMSSAVTLINIIFTYFSQRKSKGDIIINASNGRSLRFPSDISEEKMKEIISVLNEIESMQVTLKLTSVDHMERSGIHK